MNIGMMGLGKLGLPCALAMEKWGNHTLYGYDPSPAVAEILSTRMLPYREEEAQQCLTLSRLTSCVTVESLVESSDLIFVAIQTPHLPLYEGITPVPETRADFDYTYLVAGVSELFREIERQGIPKTVSIVSTVLPGTIESRIAPLLTPCVRLCYNPFFIAMGTTIQDFLNPEFVLLGGDDIRAREQVAAFYSTILQNNAPVFKTTIKNAELIKVLYNTFISTKIVFINMAMEICEKNGGNVDEISQALKLATTRVVGPKYLNGGMGDGGGCHPRDCIALSWLAEHLYLSYDLFSELMRAREAQNEWLVSLMLDYDLPPMILGYTYKAETNLTVGSPALLLKHLLLHQLPEVLCFDPYVDGRPPTLTTPHVILVGVNHLQFTEYKFPPGSVVLDPWGYIPDQPGVTIRRLGRHNDK